MGIFDTHYAVLLLLLDVLKQLVQVIINFAVIVFHATHMVLVRE